MRFDTTEQITRRHRAALSRAEVEQLLGRALIAEAGVPQGRVQGVEFDLQLDGAAIAAVHVVIVEDVPAAAQGDPAPDPEPVPTVSAPQTAAEPARAPAEAAPPADAAPAPVRHFTVPLTSELSAVQRRIRSGLNALGYEGGWSPGKDHDLAQMLGKGVKLVSVAEALACKAPEAKARWFRLSDVARGDEPALTLDQQAVLRIELRARALLADEADQ